MSQEFLAMAALKDIFHKLSGQSTAIVPTIPAPQSSDGPEQDLHRIANALERIATVLESTPLASTTPPVTGQPTYWITLPNEPALTAEPAQTSAAKPTVTPAKTPITAPTLKVISSASKPSVVTAAIKPNKTIPPAKATTATATKATPAPTSKTVIPNFKVLQQYLDAKGVTIQHPKKLPSDARIAYHSELDRVALYLGSNFAECEELYKLIKSNIVAPRESFSYSLLKANIERNHLIRGLCQMFKEADLLEECDYKGKPDYCIKLRASGKEQNFITGGWLESYTRQQIKLISRPQDEAQSNLHLILSDGNKTELDLLFTFSKKIFCVEAKTNPKLAVLQAKLERIKPLGIAMSEMLIVVAEKGEEDCQKLSQDLNGARVICLANFETNIKELLSQA